MSAEQTGEQLNRRWHELCGWKLAERRDPMGGFADACEWWRVPGGGESREQLPALHLDANLAIVEAERVFDDWYVRAERIDANEPDFDGKRTILFEGENFDKLKDEWISFKGHSIDNVCEAILRALIQSKENCGR